MFPERFSNLPEYAFPRLRALLDHIEPGGEVTHMTIGEPKHPFSGLGGPGAVRERRRFCKIPPQRRHARVAGGDHRLDRPALWRARWIRPRQVMPLNGTREGLYNVGMALCPEEKRGQRPVVLIPNPFYQVYMIAAISVGAEPVFVPATAETGHLPDYASPARGRAEPHRRGLYLFARQPAGGRGLARLLARADGAGGEMGFPAFLG